MVSTDCQYCGRPLVLTTGAEVYRDKYPKLVDKPFWACWPCGAWVGCHPATELPLGTNAKKELRKARQIVHAAFDLLWQGNKKKAPQMTRSEAYEWLRQTMGLDEETGHIAMMDEAQCNQLAVAIKRRAGYTGMPVED